MPPGPPPAYDRAKILISFNSVVAKQCMLLQGIYGNCPNLKPCLSDIDILRQANALDSIF